MLAFLPCISQRPVRFEIRSLPEYHASGAHIYLAGSFNGWNPADTNYRFARTATGDYFLEATLEEDKHEYKITRGGWDKVECKKGGGGIANRKLTVPADNHIHLDVEEWVDRYPAKASVSTASRQVKVIDTAFLIPQLKRTRRVWIYLPEGYSGSATAYPVLYMHDGQNVFDDATSFSGEWGVDEFVDSTKLKKVIVVAVDHGGNRRINEYCPYEMEKFGKGEGDAYVDFLANTLKPYIDKNYRTLPQAATTLIAGSSMGGLISMYAVLKYPGIFGVAGVFSPAFWVGPAIFDDIKKMGGSVNGKIYFYGGGKESESMVPEMLRAAGQMSKISPATVTSVVRDEGKHIESRWRIEFPLFYQWAMKN